MRCPTEDDILIKCMVYVSSGKNCVRCPTEDDILTYELEDICNSNHMSERMIYPKNCPN